MNKIVTLLAGLLVLISINASANEDTKSTNPLAPPADKATQCRKEFGFHFYPTAVVTEILTQDQIKPAESKNIIKELEADDLKVHDIVWQRAQTMKPNPFTNEDRTDDRELYQKVVTELFSKALKHNGIHDQAQIEKIFDDVQFLRTKKLGICEGYGAKSEPPRGFMPIVRSMTKEEMILEFPEAHMRLPFTSMKQADH